MPFQFQIVRFQGYIVGKPAIALVCIDKLKKQEDQGIADSVCLRCYRIEFSYLCKLIFWRRLCRKICWKFTVRGFIT